MAPPSNAIQTPPTHRHHIRELRHRERATPNGIAFLGEADVDDQNAGSEQGDGGSETDNSIECTINSIISLIIELETCAQA
jgi:hypothetical protein